MMVLVIRITTNKQMNYSPKLRQAMAEIKAVLEKHDIAGLVVLHTPGYGEHLIKLDPSYSSLNKVQVMTENGLKNGFRLLVNGQTHPDPEKAKKAISESVNMVEIMCTLAGRHVEDLIDMSEAIHSGLQNKGIDVDHTPGKDTDSREIDN